jgi:hypothetical protein
MGPDDGSWLALARYEATRNYNSPDDTRPFIAREAPLDGDYRYYNLAARAILILFMK